jgi:hypothetical protein
MASPGSGGGDRSPVPWAAVVDDLLDVHGRAAMLQTMFDEGSSSMPLIAVGRELTEGMLRRVTRALSALNTGGGASSFPGGRGSGHHRSHRRSSSSSRRR